MSNSDQLLQPCNQLITDPVPNPASDQSELASTEMAAAVLFAGLLSANRQLPHPTQIKSDQESFTRPEENSNQSSTQNQANLGIPHCKPAEGYITCEFHKGHPGVDIRLQPCSFVCSTMDGLVVFAGWDGLIRRNMVIVQNGRFSTCYAHLASIQVTTGELVTTGAALGVCGPMEQTANSYLHYEVRIDGKPENPHRFFGRKVNLFQ